MIGISCRGFLDVHRGCLMKTKGPETTGLLEPAPLALIAKPSHCCVTIEYPFPRTGREAVKPYSAFRYSVDVAGAGVVVVVETEVVVSAAEMVAGATVVTAVTVGTRVVEGAAVLAQSVSTQVEG